MLRITIRGKYGKKNEETLKRIELKSVDNLAKLGQMTADTMKQEIKNAKRRPGGNNELENSIKSHGPFPIAGGWMIGVAEIAGLPIYWRAVNYGSAHIMARGVRGAFDGERPRKGAKGQRFTANKKGYLMQPHRPIPKMNYIERTVNKIRAILVTIFR